MRGTTIAMVRATALTKMADDFLIALVPLIGGCGSKRVAARISLVLGTRFERMIWPVLFNSAAAKNLWIAECPPVRPRRGPCR